MLNIVAPHRDCTPWVEAIRQCDKNIELFVWPEFQPDAPMMLCWQPPNEAIQQTTNLKCICSMGAGVDGLVDNPEIDKNIRVVRLVDQNLKDDMYRYIQHCIEAHRMNIQHYRHSQRQGIWSPVSNQTRDKLNISILGFGEIGQFVAEQLHQNGFNVSAWKQHRAEHETVSLFHGEAGLKAMLVKSHMLICLLPLTNATRGILNLSLFQQLPEGSVLIQVGRGDHLNESDLLTSLNDGHLSAAYLDVFKTEPLPENHAFWHHPDIVVTPHIASVTNPQTVAPQIVKNYHHLLSDKPLLNEVDRKRGY